MQVILLDKVANLGSLGDQVNVKAIPLPLTAPTLP